jgi:hypothetical protein
MKKVSPSSLPFLGEAYPRAKSQGLYAPTLQVVYWGVKLICSCELSTSNRLRLMFLTVGVADEPIPRPTGAVPGLVLTYALTRSLHADHDGYLQTVECFLFPGSGQTIVTAGSVRFHVV